MVIVDSSAWIDFLNRPDGAVGQEVARLLTANEVVVVGMVLAEVLQGARNAGQVAVVDSRLAGLPYAEVTRTTWRKAAELAVHLRTEGQATALSDLLIASVALEQGHEVFTTDQDFQRVPGLKLHEARKATN
jgi:predicted nucleic acid-binding protein